jgi:hypothetical protein
MAFLDNAVAFLVHIGLLDIILPFILVFTIMLALLERTRVLGTEKGKPRMRLNAMVAFVLAFFGVVSLQEIIAIRAFGEVTSVAIIVVLVLLMTVGLLGGKVPNKLMTWLGVAICIIGGLVVLDRLDLLPQHLSDVVTMVWGPPFAIIVALFAVGWFVFREKPKAPKPAKPEAKPKAAKKGEEEAEEEVKKAVETLQRHGLIRPPGIPPEGPQ